MRLADVQMLHAHPTAPSEFPSRVPRRPYRQQPAPGSGATGRTLSGNARSDAAARIGAVAGLPTVAAPALIPDVTAPPGRHSRPMAQGCCGSNAVEQ